MAGKMRAVKWQRTFVVKTKKQYDGEQSPYWNFMDRTARPNDAREAQEHPTANPDVLVGDEDGADEYREKLREGLSKIKFSPLERKVLDLLGKGLTQEQVAKKLGRKRLTIRTIITRVQKKGEAYVAKMAHEGI